MLWYAVQTVVFITVTALVPRASAVEAGLDSTALSLTVEAYIIVLARVNAWDQMSANVNQDLRVEVAPIHIAPNFVAAQLVPRGTQRAAGVIVYSNACRELQKDHIPGIVLIGFTTLVTQSVTSVIVPSKFRELIVPIDSATSPERLVIRNHVRSVTI